MVITYPIRVISSRCRHRPTLTAILHAGDSQYSDCMMLSTPRPGLFPIRSSSSLLTTLETEHGILTNSGFLKTRGHFAGVHRIYPIQASVIRFDIRAAYFLKLPRQSISGTRVLAGFGREGVRAGFGIRNVFRTDTCGGQARDSAPLSSCKYIKSGMPLSEVLLLLSFQSSAITLNAAYRQASLPSNGAAIPSR